MNWLPWRHVLVLSLVLVAGAGIALAAARETPSAPAATAPASSTPTADQWRTYLVDVAGWYEITPNERAVATTLDLTIEGLATMPPVIGRWNGTPYDYGPAIDEWFEKPDLAVSMLYQNDNGQQAWLSAFGSRSRKSYVLFEHTPATSYPAAGWALLENSIHPIPIGQKQVYVQRATLTKEAERRYAFYWYLWSDFARNPEEGVITMRLHVPVVTSDHDALDAADDFIRSLFPQVVTWHRF